MENVTFEDTLETGVTENSCLPPNTQDSEQSSETVTCGNRKSIQRTEYGESGVPESKGRRKISNRKTDTKDCVVTNLSSRQLSQAEYDLLSKGLSFIPTQHSIDIWNVQSELAEWERRMRLREYFTGQDEIPDVEEESDSSITAALGCSKKKKSNFTPKPGRNKWLDIHT